MKCLAILTVLLALSVAACGESTTGDDNTQNQENTENSGAEDSSEDDSNQEQENPNDQGESETPDTNPDAGNSDSSNPDSSNPDSNDDPEVGDEPGDGSDENDPISNLEFEPSGEANFSADDSSVIQNLSSGEIAILCDEFEDYMEENGTVEAMKNFLCTFSGLFQAPPPSPGCETVRQACLDEDMNMTSECETGFAECGATVAEIEACLPIHSGYVVASSEKLSCEINQADLNDIIYYDTTAHEDCQAVAESCPGFFNGDD